MDLVIGDVDFSTPVLLTNGGTPQEAAMVSQSVLFPNEGHPLSLVSFPAVCQVDVNNDGLNDLMASPFDPSLVRSESIHSSWLYLGSDNGELYKFEKDDFLQDEMIDVGSGAYPLLIDVDGDGLMDLLLGNFGALDSSWYTPSTGLQCQYIASLAYLRNVGDIDKPAFRMISTDFLGLSALEMQSLIPSAGDLDGDDDIDILCGNSKGKFVYIENKAGPGNPPEFVLADPAYRQLDIGDFSAPQIIDLDLDGLNDIVSGMRNGQLAFLRNTGPVENPQYVMVTDTLGGVDVTNASLSYFGYSVPFFFTKPDNSLMLLIASEFGEVFVYEDIEENILGDFTLAGQLSVPYQGWRTAVSAGYLDNDTLVDIFIGNYSGGLGCFGGIKTSGTGIGTSPEGKQGLMIYPNPASNRVYLDLSGGDMKNNVLIQVFQADGKLIRKYSPVSLPLIMDTSGFNAGLYFISINTGSYEVSGKLFIVP